ncbi:hypothetical protein BDW71DRAFT_192327 [Aspergillus fruticulosus]
MASGRDTQDTIAEPFRSKRLVFRAIEDNEEDKTFLHTHLNESAMHLQASNSLPRPWTKKSISEIVGVFQERLLSVMICLPSGSEAILDDAADQEKAPGKESEISKAEPAWKTATPIGSLSLWYPRGSATAHHRSAIMGIWLVASARGQGYGREAINWALDWAFDIAGLHRVGLEVYGFNERALALYRSIGFVEEGRQREAFWHGRKWYDDITMGILENEWARLRGREEGA